MKAHGTRRPAAATGNRRRIARTRAIVRVAYPALLAIAVMAATPPAIAQDTGDNDRPVDRTAADRGDGASAPTITIELHQNEKTATAPFDVYVSITNLSAHSYHLRRVDLVFPAALTQTRSLDALDRARTQTRTEVGTVPLVEVDAAAPADSRVLGPFSTAFFHYPFPRYAGSVWETLVDRHTFLFLADTYRIFCIVEYEQFQEFADAETAAAAAQPSAGAPQGQDSGGPVDPQAATEGPAQPQATGAVRNSVAIEIIPPLSSIVRGGLLGALLLAGFLTVYAAFQNNDAQRPDPASWRDWIADLLRTWGWEGFKALGALALGSIVATITILLLQRISDVGLPITLEVKDWIGGLIIGLFSLQLATSLYARFLPAPPSDSAPDEENPAGADGAGNPSGAPSAARG
jgi:hypothetical protein